MARGREVEETVPVPEITVEKRVTYEAYMRDCPAVSLLSSISTRWVSLTMCTLGVHERPMRYSEVSRNVPGVSQKMLTQTLRGLERDGMVRRTVAPTSPVRVDYELTDLGWNLYGLLAQVRDWAHDNADAVDHARAAYDEL
ncbi:winged helix-turn-helix transcriptional regulator [Streptomyces sp. NPDC102274]|uniref:winged helix-turn-helix transcriptional regulator n=1 Tax=Streptomyces sp. NPDC102274 TaxID=3366151 RepID=UPI003823E54E